MLNWLPRAMLPFRFPLGIPASFIVVGELVWIVGVTAYMILQRRSPVATLGWILVLSLLPIAGVPIYLMAGPLRLQRRRLRHHRARLRVRARTPSTAAVGPSHALTTAVGRLAPRMRQVAHLAERLADAPPILAEHAELFTSGKGGMDAIAAAVRGATHHVHVLFYIFAEDGTGTALRDLLAAKAKEGVHVRILVDALGSSSLRRAFLQPLRDAGAEVVFFHPPRLSLRMPKINFRNHRKIVVCDGRIGFTGGLNVADEYVVGRPGEPPWRDTMVELVGPPVEWLQLHFLEDWQYATGTSPFGSLYFPAHLPTGKTLVQVVGSAPDMELRPLHGVYFAAINAARTRVYVSTPYFVPDEALLQALVVAALRGVDVRVLVPQRNDHTFVAAASRSYFDELLRAGVRIFEYRPTMHHAKTLVIDDELGIVGTANMDTRSMRLSFEVAALLFDETLTRELAIHFEEDARQADEVTAAQRSPISLGSRLLEGGTRLFSPLL